GGEWVTPLKVADTPGGSDGNKHVQVALDSNNCAHYVWEGIGVGGKHDIFYETVCVEGPVGAFIEVDKSFLTFDMEEGESPDPQTFKIKSYGEDALDYTISSDKPWLIVSPQSGTATEEWDTINVVVDAENFQAGKRSGMITITAPDAYNSPVKISVSLTIEKKKTPYIQLNRSLFYFFAFARGDNPGSQTFRIKNSGAQTLNYQISSNKSWLKVSPAQGSSTGEWDTITVSADVSSLGIDKHKGVIKITASGAENSPQSINVEFEVVLPPYPYPPTSVQLRRTDHEGLMVKNYISRIDWQANSKNDGLFNIVNYRIFRKKNSEPISAYAFVDEVGSNVFNYYDQGFSSKSERDMYCYAVTCIDDAGRASLKAETSGFGSVLTFVNSERKALKERNSSTIKKH
ncbi:MAG: BACON domain-containing protein, partial [Candidatus Aminicenantes bacterium]|nr:BACON domain-containing protein [Candidatus Aminicenantes bacterium]